MRLTARARTIAVALLAVFFCGAAEGCTASHQVTVGPAPTDGVALPLEMVAQLPVTVARIGEDDVRLIVDLGGHDVITLRPDVAKRIEAVRTGWRRSLSFDAAGGMSFNRKLSIPEVRLGDLVLADVEGHSIDFSELDRLPGVHERIDGYVGAAVLRQFRMLVSYPDRVVLYPKQGPLPIEVSAWRTIEFDEKLRSRGTIDGRYATIGWDTGANHTVVDLDSDERFVHVAATIGGDDYGDMQMAVVDLSGAGVDALLGYDFFSSYRVLFDFDDGVAYVEVL